MDESRQLNIPRNRRFLQLSVERQCVIMAKDFIYILEGEKQEPRCQGLSVFCGT